VSASSDAVLAAFERAIDARHELARLRKMHNGYDQSMGEPDYETDPKVRAARAEQADAERSFGASLTACISEAVQEREEALAYIAASAANPAG
jgi:hypothetical protein